MSLANFTFNDQWGNRTSELNRAFARKKINDNINYLKGLERSRNITDEIILLHHKKHRLKELLKMKAIIAKCIL